VCERARGRGVIESLVQIKKDSKKISTEGPGVLGRRVTRGKGKSQKGKNKGMGLGTHEERKKERK